MKSYTVFFFQVPSINVALCRHPGQIFSLFNGMKSSMRYEFNLTVGQMSLMEVRSNEIY